MKTVLFLVHRIPYPPNKGDKIRSYHLLRVLSRHFRVLLGAFVDSEEDWQFRGEVAELCAEVCLVPLNGRWARCRSLIGILSNEPLTVPYYRDAAMASWVRAKVAEGVDVAVVFSSSMAQYVVPFRNLGQRIIDFVDLDSEKWKQYGAAQRGLLGAIYRREGRLLADYERMLALGFSGSVFVSDAEAEPLVRETPALAARVHGVGNGVDHQYFDPLVEVDDPYHGEKAVVFTGAMDYWANVDAVVWFAREVWGRVVREEPAARFFIVGTKPVKSVRALTALPGVSVTGTVKDVRLYLKFASVAVAPLRVARGIQNKILEALAMGLPVVATSAAVRGLVPTVRGCVAVADDPGALASEVVRMLRLGRSATIAERNRSAVIAAYDWTFAARQWRELLHVDVPARAVGGAIGSRA